MNPDSDRMDMRAMHDCGSMGIETLWDVVVDLDGVAGLAGVADALAQRDINIHSVCCIGGTSPVACHLLVSDGETAAAVLAAAGVPAGAREVMVCVLQNRPGTLAAVSAALNATGATVDVLYQATERGLVIGADDLGRVRAAIVSSGRLATAEATGEGVASAPSGAPRRGT